MTYNNPVVAGTVLVREAIKSPDYVPNVSGWTVNRDGSAEFNNIIIRGGTTIGSVSLWYDGTPTFGNLIFSISGQDGTDTYGNGYLQGITAYAPGGVNSNVNMNNGNIYFPGGLSTTNAPTILGAGGTAVARMIFQSGIDATDTFEAQMTLQPGSVGTPGANNSPYLELRGPAGEYVDFHVRGFCQRVDSFGALEIWRDMASYVNGWTQATTVGDHNGMNFKMLSIGGIAIDGVILKQGTGAVNNGEQFGTVPSSIYRPSSTRWIQAAMDINASGTLQQATVQVRSNGTLFYFGPAVAAGNSTRLFVTGMYMRDDT